MMPEQPTETALLVAFARLEGKVDITLTELAGLKAEKADHESRLRAVEAQDRPDRETNARIRALEDRRVVTPSQLWAGLVGVVGLIAAGIASINGILNALGVQ